MTRAMRRLLLAVLALLVLAVLVQAGRILWLGGVFRGISPHFEGRCRLVAGPVGTEDLTIDPRSGVAYLSASDRRAVLAGAPRPGGIWAYDLASPEPRPVNLTPDADASFQPHGISLWSDGAGPDVLFVVNHAPLGQGAFRHTVEIFDVGEAKLVHRASLADPLLVTPNDVVAVARNRFYVTNTHRNPPGFWQTLETYLQLSGAQVLFYGPNGFRAAIDDQPLPNGINVSADGRTLYLASVTSRSVLLYDRDPASEALRLRERVALGSGPDNIEVDAAGALWIGSHPKLLTLQSHLDDPKALAPSQVLRVRRGDDGAYDVDEVYLDDGEQIAGASVAGVRGTRMLIGQILGEGFLDCEMATSK
jgi:arylesterase/paraoxonase